MGRFGWVIWKKKKKGHHLQKKKKKKSPPPPAPAAPAAPPPAPAAPGGGGMLSGLAGTVMQGMAFGTGSAVAHRAVDAIAGPREMKVVHENSGGQSGDSSNAPTPTPAPSSNDYTTEDERCRTESVDFNQCVKDNSGNLQSCRFLYDILTQCQSQAQQSSQQWS